MTGVIIDKVGVFALKKANTLHNEYQKRSLVLSNKSVNLLLRYSYAILEFSKDSDNFHRRCTTAEEILHCTKHNPHMIEHLACGITRVKIFEQWWFDIYHTLPDDIVERELLDVFEIEDIHNQKLLDAEMNVCQRIQNEIEYYLSLGNN